jgi:hypothetical protein
MEELQKGDIEVDEGIFRMISYKVAVLVCALALLRSLGEILEFAKLTEFEEDFATNQL